jgi:hypothetical protein
MTTDTGRAIALATRRARGTLDHYLTYRRLLKLPLPAIRHAHAITRHAIETQRASVVRGELMTAAGVLALALHRDLKPTTTNRGKVQ